MGLALLILGFALLAAALHPFSTYPASLRLLPRRPLVDAQPSGRAALCVCFYNEEQVVDSKIANMLAARRNWPGLELFAYVDAASDKTAEILSVHQDDIRLVVSQRRLGKTAGMNTLVSMTDADYVVFSDANVMFADGAVPALLAPFADPSVGCVCGHLIYTSGDDGATARTGSLYWKLEETIKRLESATGSVMGADGSIFAIRRALHVPAPADLIDDLYLSLSVLCAGSRIVRADAAHAFEPVVSRSAEEFRRKTRIACQAFNVHRALRPSLALLSLQDRYKYISHKLLRWMTAYLLAVAGICILTGIAASGHLAAAAALAVAALAILTLIVRSPSGPLGQIREILAAFVATGLGVWRSLRGDHFQTWTPPNSARAPATAILQGEG